MTKQSGKSKDKDEEHFIILRRLASGQAMQPKDFEKTDETQESLPHSSIFYRLKDLVNYGWIEGSKTKNKSKRGLPIKEYRITFYGFLKLLALSKDKGYLSDLMGKIQLHLPLIPYNFSVLKSLFTEEKLFETLVDVCCNTIIEIDFNAKKPDYSRPKLTRYTVPITGNMLYIYKWIHTYHVEMKITQSDITYTIMEDIVIGGEQSGNGAILKKSTEPFLVISSLIICAFYHELINRCQTLRYIANGYPGNRGKLLVMEILRTNKIVFPEYLKFLSKLQKYMTRGTNEIIQIKKSISRKKSLFK